MTQVLQSGQHPDADQLNAFVEHALPPHEQQQMLAHLAVCPDCRAIAHLAQPELVEEATLPRAVVTRRPWFSGWNLALPAGLAVAFLVILTVHLHNVSTTKHDAEANKTAHLEPTLSPPQTPSPAAQAVTPKPVPAPIQKPAFSANALAAASASNTATMPGAAQQTGFDGYFAGRSPNARPSPDYGVMYDAAHGEQPLQAVKVPTETSPARATPSGAAQTATLSNVDSAHRELRSSGTQYNSTAASAQSTPHLAFQAAPPPPLSPPAPASVNEAVAVANQPAMLETESSASSQPTAGKAMGSLAGTSLKMKKQPSLPSHLAALSTISNARQELAIDSAGALFRSEDAGVTWQPIPAQWTGRAVKLQLSATPTTQSMAKTANSVAAMPAAAQPVFELTNDEGIVWVSSDGRTWKRK
jgi:Putative zinc-finger